jgi:hypothetical protein
MCKQVVQFVTSWQVKPDLWLLIRKKCSFSVAVIVSANFLFLSPQLTRIIFHQASHNDPVGKELNIQMHLTLSFVPNTQDFDLFNFNLIWHKHFVRFELRVQVSVNETSVHLQLGLHTSSAAVREKTEAPCLSTKMNVQLPNRQVEQRRSRIRLVENMASILLLPARYFARKVWSSEMVYTMKNLLEINFAYQK